MRRNGRGRLAADRRRAARRGNRPDPGGGHAAHVAARLAAAAARLSHLRLPPRRHPAGQAARRARRRSQGRGHVGRPAARGSRGARRRPRGGAHGGERRGERPAAGLRRGARPRRGRTRALPRVRQATRGLTLDLVGDGADNLHVVAARVLSATVLALTVLALGASTASAAAPADSSARALGVQVALPGGEGDTAVSVSSPPERSTTAAGYSYGEWVSTGSLSASSRAGGSTSRASAGGSASVQAVSFFGGEITADSVFVKATAQARGSGAEGSLGASSLSNLTVLGVPVTATPNARVELGDWGYAIVLEQAVVRQTKGRFGYRGFVTGLHVVLTADHGGLLAGSEIRIGYAEAAASAPKPPPPPTPSPPPSPPADDQPAPKSDPAPAPQQELE